MSNKARTRAEFIKKATLLHLVVVECPRCKTLYGVPKFLPRKMRTSCCNSQARRIVSNEHVPTGGLKAPLSISKEQNKNERSRTEKEAEKWAAWMIKRLDRADSLALHSKGEKSKREKEWWEKMAGETIKQLNRNDLLALLGKRSALPSRRPESGIDYFWFSFCPDIENLGQFISHTMTSWQNIRTGLT